MLELFFFNFLNSISFAFVGSYQASFKRQLVLLLLFTFPLLFFLVNIKHKILVLYLFVLELQWPTLIKATDTIVSES